MAEIRQFPRPEFPATRQNVALKNASAQIAAAHGPRYCVYNQTREHFVATGVEAVDASAGELEAHLRRLDPGGQTGLWILPCREISATCIRFPLDLVYLDNDGVVLEAIASFPLASQAVSSGRAASVLALPANVAVEGEIHADDRLIVSLPEEMKRHLKNMQEAKAQAREDRAPLARQSEICCAGQPTGPVAEPETRSGAFRGTASADPYTIEPSLAPQINTQPWIQQAPTNWFNRLLRKGPVDPRKTARESLPGLIAYYFTGGTPMGHPVRNISARGMYIVTSDRWYAGTVLRVTLTDQHDPRVERSITVNAKVVRSASDGVGLEFVLDEPDRHSRLTLEQMERANGMAPAEIAEFLRIYKGLPKQK
ncbi:MAG: PilZ domain-containing protein [Terracidiphilus sp.]